VDIAANPPFEGVPEEEKVEDKPVKAVDIVDAFILQVRVNHLKQWTLTRLLLMEETRV
jgi:hypothetical protein